MSKACVRAYYMYKLNVVGGMGFFLRFFSGDVFVRVISGGGKPLFRFLSGSYAARITRRSNGAVITDPRGITMRELCLAGPSTDSPSASNTHPSRERTKNKEKRRSE